MSVIRCETCDTPRFNSDPLNPGSCPSCGGFEKYYERCKDGEGPDGHECPAETFDRSVSNSDSGRLIALALQFFDDTRLGITVTTDDIRADVYEVILTLESERGRLEKDNAASEGKQ